MTIDNAQVTRFPYEIARIATDLAGGLMVGLACGDAAITLPAPPEPLFCDITALVR